MTLANIGPTVLEPSGCEVWPWHEFGLFVADSEGILAAALTPQAVVLLTLVDTDRLGSPPPLPASARGWTPLPAPPPGRPRAKQRSPPEQGGERGRGKFLKQEVQVDAVRSICPGCHIGIVASSDPLPRGALAAPDPARVQSCMAQARLEGGSR